MSGAWIAGREVSLDDALAKAAEVIGGAHLPVITGLGTDVAGIKAALALARAAGGVVDHAHSEGIYPLISAVRDGGMFLASSPEMRRRADRILVVGPDAFAADPDLPAYLFAEPPDLGVRTRGEEGRKLLWLSPPAEMPNLPNAVEIERLECPPEQIGDVLAVLRACLAGRRHGEEIVTAERAGEVVDFLKAAGFGCAIFAPSKMQSLEVEMIAGLVSDLNVGTRFSCLPVLQADQAYGAALVTTFDSGFPLRVSYARAESMHDPHLYEAQRLIGSGEADAVILIEALGDAPAGDLGLPADVPTVALLGGAPNWKNPPAVAFDVALAGRDHDGALYNGRFGGFVPYAADRAPAETKPTAADILRRIAGALSPERSAA